MSTVPFIITLFSIILLTACAGKHTTEPLAKSDHFDGEEFYNPIGDPETGPIPFLYWKLIENPTPWPKHIPNEFSDSPPERVEGDQLRISFVGHATTLIQTQGVNILTDPVWSDRIGPSELFSDKRVIKPGIPFKKLPKIDLIFISHNHYDHLDLKTIEKIWKRDQPIIVVPLKNTPIIHQHNSKITVHELDWHQSFKYNDKITIHLEPAQHWSERTLFDENKALWGSYVIQTPTDRILFMGDSGYGEGKNFQHLYQTHGPFRAALLPIGAYDPRWYTKHHHMNPEEAVLAHKILGSPPTLGIHFGSFHLTDEGYMQPVEDLEIAREKHQVSKDAFRTIHTGQAWNVE